MIELEQVNKTFAARGAPTANGFRALDEISLTIAEGEFVTIIGPSGCGKSTLLNLISGILPPTSGTIRVDGLEPEAARLQRYFGIVFQKAVLLPWKSVLDNVLLPLEIAGHPPDEARRNCSELLRLVGLTGSESRWVHQLSGGMQQRVAVARALSFNPRILLMDEPFGALDDITRRRMDEELLEIWRTTGKTIIFITHNIQEAVYLSQRVVVMSTHPGRILAVEPIAPSSEKRMSASNTIYGDHIDRLGMLLGAGSAAPPSAGVRERLPAQDGKALSPAPPEAAGGSRSPASTAPASGIGPWWARRFEAWREFWSTNQVAVAAGAGVILIWELAVRIGDVPRYLLPAPSAIALAFYKNSALILRNTGVTLVEILLGFLVATAVALLLAMLMIISPTFRKAVYPYLIASQTTPHIAWAPLLLIWLGFGMLSKVVVAALVAFFPVVVNALDGMDSVDADVYRLFRSLAASRRDVLLRLQLPYALTHIFSGLRVAMAFSVVGAIIAEWVGAERGLGVIIIRTMFDLRVDLMFAIIIVLSVLGTSLFMLVGWIENLAMPWREAAEHARPRQASIV